MDDDDRLRRRAVRPEVAGGGVAVSVTLPPGQKVVGPLAAMVGTGGAATVVSFDRRRRRAAAVAIEGLHAVRARRIHRDGLRGRTVGPEPRTGRTCGQSHTAAGAESGRPARGDDRCCGRGVNIGTPVAAEVALQPEPSVVCTENDPLLLTTIDCVVAPFDQSQELAALAVRVTLPPAQNDTGPLAVIVGVAAAGLATTFTGAEVTEQPVAFVTLTVTDCVVLTTMDCVVSAVDQSHDEPALAVNVTLPPLQKVVGPEGVMVAVGVETLTAVLPLTVGHDVTKTSTPSVTGPVVLASKVITLPVLEPAIVPLVIDQT